jgi:hypothetical protein
MLNAHAAFSKRISRTVLSSSFEIRPLLSTLYLKVSLMRTRNPRARRQIQKAKGDLLAQKWMTNLLAFILILLIVAFAILSIPAVKKQIVDFVRVLRYGKEQKPKRPEIRLENPFHIFKFSLRGNSHAYRLDTL